MAKVDYDRIAPTLLTADEYRAGRRRIDEAIARGEASGTPATFPVDIALASVIGRRAA